MKILFDIENKKIQQEYTELLSNNLSVLATVNENAKQVIHSQQPAEYADSLGWIDTNKWAGASARKTIMEHAKKIQKNADVFIVIGVGGSNNSARSVIEALKNAHPTCEIVYSGNNLSGHYYEQLIEKYQDKSIYINVIAKNFETLEPGIGFRVWTDFLKEKYGQQYHERVYITGTVGSHLHDLSLENNYPFLIFPEDIGGRFSSKTDVGLLPMAVAGIDIEALLQGASEMQQSLINDNDISNISYQYAVMRKVLLNNGYTNEILAHFEPQFISFGKWWTQLFAESEGKENTGLFPVALSYSEELHSVGQYVQQGIKMLFETFLIVENSNATYTMKPNDVADRFEYLDGKTMWEVNKIAEEATINAHVDEGIPVIKLEVANIDAKTFGEIFYFFEYACYLSAKMIGVNPFGQPGVEAYKKYMFAGLKK